jgi:putative transposase
MGNHYHLLVETPLANLGEAMHRINRGYVQQFNATHEREGHLFERRYRSWVMRDQARQMEALRYIVRNPVRAGLCSAPKDWPWSSHGAAAGLRACPPFLTLDVVHGWFGATSRDAARAYAAFIDAGKDKPHERPPLERAIGGGTMAEIAVANRCYGYPLREIAALVGISAATLSRRLRSETLVPGTGVSSGTGLLGREAVLDRRPAASDL